DRLGNLWVGTLGQGLWRVRNAGGPASTALDVATDQTGLSNNTASSLFEDREGNIWVGTSNGLNRLTPHKFVQMSELGLVTGLELSPDGGIWAGTADGIIRITPGQSQRAARYLRGMAIRAMYADAH